MTAPADRPAPVALAEGWRVEIPMPVTAGRGRNGGKPVGWLSSNNIKEGRGAAIARRRVKNAWRAAAYQAYMRRRLPTGLGRIYVQVQFRFTENREQEPANFELTIKPIIDALQPLKHYVQDVKKGGVKVGERLVVEQGIGMIPTDGPQHLVRGPEMAVGPPLGRNNPVRGMVIVYIVPLPPEAPPSAT